MDLSAALTHLSRPASRVGPTPGWRGAPSEEFTRSPAAATVGRLAERSGLLLAHHEHRAFLPLPEGWIAPGREGEAAPPEWVDGVLPEAKYQSFRHDLPVGGFHPGHRAKWTTHELCHGLVGTAWHPDATPLFHATASRVAELVPVVLWYFLDEIGLRRCPRHAEPQFRTFCAACARAAAEGGAPWDPARAESLLHDAARFLDRELAAVARTLRTGVLHPHVYGSLDLCSDGVAYAAAHGTRLTSRTFRTWAEAFWGESPTTSASLEALMARAEAVFLAIATGADLSPSTVSPAHLDLAQRVLQGVGDPPAAQLRAATTVVQQLASGVALPKVMAAYAERALRYGWADAEDVFATGYALDGLQTRCVRQVREGLGTVTPLVLDLASDAGLDVVPAFTDADRWERRPLGLRFAAWLAEHHAGPAAEVARFEASLRAVSGEPEATVLGADGDGVRWVEGSIRLAFDHDIPTFAEDIEAGEVSGLDRAGHLGTTRAPAPTPVAVVLGRDVDGELLYVDLPPALPAGWEQDAARLGDLAEELITAGVATPLTHRW